VRQSLLGFFASQHSTKQPSSIKSSIASVARLSLPPAAVAPRLVQVVLNPPLLQPLPVAKGWLRCVSEGGSSSPSPVWKFILSTDPIEGSQLRFCRRRCL